LCSPEGDREPLAGPDDGAVIHRPRFSASDPRVAYVAYVAYVEKGSPIGPTPDGGTPQATGAALVGDEVASASERVSVGLSTAPLLFAFELFGPGRPADRLVGIGSLAGLCRPKTCHEAP
jgi:hypothetical protein